MKVDMFWGLMDQALQSLVNFGVGLALIQYAVKEEYGLYGVGFATLLLLVGVSNALVTTQMTVIAPGKEKAGQDAYCASMLAVQLMIFVPLALLILIGNWLYGLWFPDPIAGLVLVVAVTSPAVLFLEFMRRFFYLKLKPSSVFFMDLLYAGVYIVSLLFILSRYDHRLHVFTLAGNGLAALLAGGVFLARSGIGLKGAWAGAAGSFKEAWRDGRWALGGVTVTWLQSQGYVYVLAALKGSASVAEANAARLFLAPLGILGASFTKVFLPRLVHLRYQGRMSRAVSIARNLLLVLLICIVAYSGFLLTIQEWVVGHVMSGDYQTLGTLIALWAGVFLCQAFRNNNSMLLQVLRSFRSITLANAITAMLVFGASILVVAVQGIEGVLVVMAGGELLLALALWKIFRRAETRDEY